MSHEGRRIQAHVHVLVCVQEWFFLARDNRVGMPPRRTSLWYNLHGVQEVRRNRMAHGSSLFEIHVVVRTYMMLNHMQCCLLHTRRPTPSGEPHTATWGPGGRNRRHLGHRSIVANDATTPVRWASGTSSPTHGRDTENAHLAASASSCPPGF